MDSTNSAISGSEQQADRRPRSWVDLSLDFTLPLSYHLSHDSTPFDHVERERNKLRDRCSKLKPVAADAPSVQYAGEISIPLPSESHSRAADLAPRQEFVVLPILEFPVIPDAPETSAPLITESHSPVFENASLQQVRSPFKSVALEMPTKVSFTSMHALKMLDADIAASSAASVRDKLNDTLSSLQVQMLNESIAPVVTRTSATSHVVHDFVAPALIPLTQSTESRAAAPVAPQGNLSLIDELLAKLAPSAAMARHDLTSRQIDAVSSISDLDPTGQKHLDLERNLRAVQSKNSQFDIDLYRLPELIALSPVPASHAPVPSHTPVVRKTSPLPAVSNQSSRSSPTMDALHALDAAITAAQTPDRSLAASPVVPQTSSMDLFGLMSQATQSIVDASYVSHMHSGGADLLPSGLSRRRQHDAHEIERSNVIETSSAIQAEPTSRASPLAVRAFGLSLTLDASMPQPSTLKSLLPAPKSYVPDVLRQRFRPALSASFPTDSNSTQHVARQSISRRTAVDEVDHHQWNASVRHEAGDRVQRTPQSLRFASQATPIVDKAPPMWSPLSLSKMQTPIKDGVSIEHEEVAPTPSVNVSLFSHLEATDPEPQGRAVRADEFDNSDWGSQIDEAPDTRDIGHESMVFPAPTSEPPLFAFAFPPNVVHATVVRPRAGWLDSELLSDTDPEQLSMSAVRHVLSKMAANLESDSATFDDEEDEPVEVQPSAVDLLHNRQAIQHLRNPSARPHGSIVEHPTVNSPFGDRLPGKSVLAQAKTAGGLASVSPLISMRCKGTDLFPC